MNVSTLHARAYPGRSTAEVVNGWVRSGLLEPGDAARTKEFLSLPTMPQRFGGGLDETSASDVLNSDDTLALVTGVWEELSTAGHLGNHPDPLESEPEVACHYTRIR